MAKKLTITIPDELAERLAPWRERMNLSRICSAALEREVAARAELADEVREFAALIARLRAQKPAPLRRDYQAGLDSGVAYAKAEATYQEFVRYEDLWQMAQALGEQAEAVAGDWELPPAEGRRLVDLRRRGLVEDGAVYRLGWLDGLMAVWYRVEGKV
jgi:post-segregation antitoxin (ccd killing protein)